MAIYFYDNSKLPVGKPIYGFAYRVADDGTVLKNYKPTLGKIEETARYSRNGRFIPNKSSNSNRWAQYTTLIYADTYEEAVEAYNRIVETHISNLENKIRVAEKMIEEAKADIIKEDEESHG